MGRRPTTDGVTAKGDRIQIRFTWRGQDLRPTLAMKPTAANMAAARRIRRSIQDDIRAGIFNLAEHFPEYRFRERVEADVPEQASNRTFKDWADQWLKFQARELEHSTITVYRSHLRTYWTSLWGDRMPRTITHEMVLERLSDLSAGCVDPNGVTHKALSRKTQNNILIPLRGVFQLACKGLPGLRNPTDGIDNLKTQSGDPDPFTLEEAEIVLRALAKRNEALADYFEFMFFAGLRNSEQIALLWQDVDLHEGTIKVRRARVLTQDKERTKTHTERTVELNARARAVIRRQEARTRLAGGVVFLNPFTGRQWHDDQEQRREWAAAIKTCGVRYRPPKECRDTSVTLALMSGASPLWVANQHGHSLTVMMKSYAKWIPQGDQGRNLEAVNGSIGFRTDSALEGRQGAKGGMKSST